MSYYILNIKITSLHYQTSQSYSPFIYKSLTKYNDCDFIFMSNVMIGHALGFHGIGVNYTVPSASDILASLYLE